jgi:glycosyltransferase involved in cell wall biosynthesis
MPDVMMQHHVFALIPRKVRGDGAKDVSLAMLEAAACGLGVVGTDISGLADSLRTSNGSKAPAENVDKIASVIEKVAQRTVVTDGGEEVFGRMRTWEEVALELEMLLEDLVYE